MKHSAHRYAAELLGTFLLTLLVRLSLVVHFPVPTPVIAGLTLGLGVYMLGGISGAHLNPAVTIGLASIRKISLTDAVVYIVAQLLGAYIALLAADTLTGATLALVVTDSVKVAVAEGLGAGILVLGVSSVVHGKVADAASGLTIGTSLALGAFAASSSANGIVNPAVALGLGSFSLAYVVGPIVGGLAAAAGYKALVKGA